MAPPKVSREEFRRIWDECGGSPAEVARALEMTVNKVHARRQRMQADGIEGLETHPDRINGRGFTRYAYERRAELAVDDGLIVAFGDMHCRPLPWRDGDTPAMAALLAFLHANSRHIRLLLCMGDCLDGGSIGRHPPLGWESKPPVEDEIAAVQHDLARIREAAPHAERMWIVGNHDERFDRTLAMRIPEFRDTMGMRLADHFPDWRMAWSAHINRRLVAVHRWHGGVHAVHNNLLKSGGAHVITGDTHRLRVYPYSGQLGIIYGVETGTLADPTQQTFEYTRGIEPNWQSGFVAWPVAGGEFQTPEAVLVDGKTKPRFRVRAA